MTAWENIASDPEVLRLHHSYYDKSNDGSLHVIANRRYVTTWHENKHCITCKEDTFGVTYMPPGLDCRLISIFYSNETHMR